MAPATETAVSPGPGDAAFIARAVAARADDRVTGNRRHFPEPHYRAAVAANARQPLDRIAAQP